jgi:hypothetical protein
MGYNMMQLKTMKWRNAYLLFYERKIPEDINSDEEKEAEKSSNPSADEQMASAPNIPAVEDDIEMQSVGQSKLGQTLTAPVPHEIEEKIIFEN